MQTVLVVLVAVTLVAVVVSAVLRRTTASPSGDLDAVFARQRTELQNSLSEVKRDIEGRLDRHAAGVNESLSQSRTEVNARLDQFNDSTAASDERSRTEAAAGRAQLEQLLAERLLVVEQHLKELQISNEARLRGIELTTREAVEKLQTSNEAKLEQMRETVDEKLHGTLEKRLGESFQQVTQQLEQVAKGLGEMQSLASGVGDLKRVLTNVKSRGNWGEMQLGRLLEDMLTPGQYELNVNVNPDSAERVEFAIRLPGRDDDRPVYLPIDAKFPQEDYERLQAAQESGTADEIEFASKALERALKTQAKTISDKYLVPPATTDFAIMYLPTEGLYAEAIRRPGLAYQLQQEFRVLITGPTTLMAILNSLQMGFRTLKLEKSASEVWGVLAKAKGEFEKYAVVWDKLAKQLNTAHKTATDGAVRSRAIGRALRDVETEPSPLGGPLEFSAFELVADTTADAEDELANQLELNDDLD